MIFSQGTRAPHLTLCVFVCHVCILSKTGQLVFGSKHVKQKMKQAFDCTCDCVCEGEVKTWEGAFKDDNMELIKGTQVMEVGGDGDDIVNNVQAESTMVNYKQCSDKKIRTQILAIRG